MSPGRPRGRQLLRRRWVVLLVPTALALLVVPRVAGSPGSSAAQATDPFTVEVSKTTDLVSGETIEVNFRTSAGSIVHPGTRSDVYTCALQGADSYVKADFSDGTCVPLGVRLQEADVSQDSDHFYRFPDSGAEQGRRGIAILRPGVGTGNWRRAGVDFSLTCGPANPCRLVYDLFVQTGSADAVEYIRGGPELSYRPVEGVAGCEGSTADAVTSTMPDRLQEAWLAWTRDFCGRASSPPPTTSFFQPEGDALRHFAAGDYDLGYSAVGYRPGFQPETERPMVPVPIGLNAVVIAAGGGYTVGDGSWPQDLPRPHAQFRLTNQEAAVLFGQSQASLVFNDQYVNEMLANNPEIPASLYLFNSNVSAPVALTGAQSTTFFATMQFDTLAGDQWTNIDGSDRGVESDFNHADPVHDASFLSLKTGRPDLARLAYSQRYSQGTFYVLTDLATANALGLTVVSMPNAAGEWITPTPETLAAAVPQMVAQEDGTLLPNPQATAGYPLTFVEYAMAPAEPLVDANCTARTGSEDLLHGWLDYVTTDGQDQLTGGDGLVPLTPQLRDAAATAREAVGATPNECATPPPPTNPPPTTPPGNGVIPSNSLGPGGEFGSGPFTGSGSSGANGGSATPTQEATAETAAEALEAAQDDGVDLPGLSGIRAINQLMPPAALLAVAGLTTAVALATAGYPVPASVRRLPRQAGATARRLRRGGRRGRRGSGG